MKKIDSVKILSFLPVKNDMVLGLQIFGLGDDSNVYYWSYSEGCWFLNKVEKQNHE